MIYQPHAFEAVQRLIPLPESPVADKPLACRPINGERSWPGDCPLTRYNQPLVGRYKLHCFYEPTAKECENG